MTDVPNYADTRVCCMTTKPLPPASPFILSIEIAEGEVIQHPYHLGTIERVARQCAEDIFRSRVANDQPVITVALIRDRKVFDVYMGDRWMSQTPVDADD